MATAATEVEEASGPRSQMWKHEAMVDWINSYDEVDLDTLDAATIIAYAFARRVEWRASETYQELVAEHAAEAEAEKARKAAARKEAAAAAKAAAEAEAEADAAPVKKAAKATKAAKASKATKATKATKAPPAKRAARATKAAAEDPFA